jgi:hypothetical protein
MRPRPDVPKRVCRRARYLFRRVPLSVKRLEQGAHVALIVVCCVATYVLITERTNWFRRSPPPPIRVGERLDLPGQKWNSARMTLVLAINSRCHFCEESLPSYRKLSSLRHSAEGKRYQLVAVSQEPRDSLSGFLQRSGVDVDEILSVPLSTLRIRGTPTVVVADSSGVARYVFVGKLNPDKEAALMQAVRAYCPGCSS